MGQGRPNNNFINTPYRPPGLIATISTRPNYRGTTHRKLPTRGGLSIRPHAGGAGPSASSSPSVVNPTSVTGPFLGASSSLRPSTVSPTSVAGQFQGASASSPSNVRPRGTSGPSFATGPFQGASASTSNRFMQFIPTPEFRHPPPKKP